MTLAKGEPASAASVRRLGTALGAEVIGLDVSRPLDADTVQWVRAAIDEHHVLCLRDQRLTSEEQIAFSKQLGPLEIFPEKDKTKDESTIYHVANVSPDGEHLDVNDPRSIFQRNNARWHTDSSYRFIPSFVSIMYGIEVLPGEAKGGETDFSNMFAAYDALTDETRERIEGLHMVHYYDCIRRLEPAMTPMTAEERDGVPPVSHPLVRVHPERGFRRSLYFSANVGAEISGMTLEEGRTLHRQLLDHVNRPAFRYQHRWRQGDLVIWDNRCLLHRGVAYDMGRYRRVLRRTTVAGRGPVLGPYSAEVRKARQAA